MKRFFYALTLFPWISQTSYQTFSKNNNLYFKYMGKKNANSVLSQWLLEYQFQEEDASPLLDTEIRYTDDTLEGPFKLSMDDELFNRNQDMELLKEIIEWSDRDKQLELYSLVDVETNEDQIVGLLRKERDLRVYGFCVSPTSEYETKELCSLLALEFLQLASDAETPLTFFI